MAELFDAHEFKKITQNTLRVLYDEKISADIIMFFWDIGSAFVN